MHGLFPTANGHSIIIPNQKFRYCMIFLVSQGFGGYYMYYIIYIPRTRRS